MKEIRLVRGSQGWLAQFVGDENTVRLFGTDTIPTAFTDKASPNMVKRTIERLNPQSKVVFA